MPREQTRLLADLHRWYACFVIGLVASGTWVPR